MASNNDAESKAFIFTWNVENLSYYWKRNFFELASPSFVVDAMEKTKWSLRLSPIGDLDFNSMCCLLCREADCKGPDSIHIGFELSLLGTDGLTSISETSNGHSFSKDEEFGGIQFEEPNEVLEFKRDTPLPRDILTFRCRMWKINANLQEEGQCVARTLLTVNRWNFVWAIENFTSLKLGEKVAYQIYSVTKDEAIMSLNFYWTGRQRCFESFSIELISSDPDITLCIFRPCLVDAKGRLTSRLGGEFSFDEVNRVQKTGLLLSRERLLDEKNLFLPNDVLTLQCSIAIPTGFVTEEIEYISCTRTSFQTRLRTICRKVVEDSSLNALKENMNYLFSDGFLSDTKLQTVTGTFPAHKSILSARSPVFKAMFSNNMKEKVADCVHIEDLNDVTVRRMLLYLYTAVVEDLQWESAFQLYNAADKYQILTLKMKCSEFLKSNICLANASELSAFADMHHDDDLKSYVRDFVLRNDEDGAWKHVMEFDLKLPVYNPYLMSRFGHPEDD